MEMPPYSLTWNPKNHICRGLPFRDTFWVPCRGVKETNIHSNNDVFICRCELNMRFLLRGVMPRLSLLKRELLKTGVSPFFGILSESKPKVNQASEFVAHFEKENHQELKRAA